MRRNLDWLLVTVLGGVIGLVLGILFVQLICLGVSIFDPETVRSSVVCYWGC